jgi:hypothetical protein
MRFRSRLSQLRIFIWLGYGVILAAGLRAKGQPLWLCALVGLIGIALLFLPPYLFWYWDIRDSYFAQRRYFSRIVMPYSKIIYVGPMSTRMHAILGARSWIEVRSADGRIIIAQPADSKAFLNEMRKHLPEITLNL